MTEQGEEGGKDDTRPAVSVRGLRKSYDSKVVLDGLDFELRAGEILGYVGPNGAGKTTTVRILTGLEQAFDGEVRVAGCDVREESLRVKERIGFVPETALLYDTLTAVELISLVGRVRRLPDEVWRPRGERLFAAFDLSEAAHRRLGSLSKGMRQKVLLSCALLHDPEVLFLDEPLSGLDVGSTMLLKEFLRRFAASGRSVFYCSHLMDVVERVCDRIVVLHQGAIQAVGTFEELSAARSGGSLESIFAEITHEESAVEKAQAVMDAVRGHGA